MDGSTKEEIEKNFSPCRSQWKMPRILPGEDLWNAFCRPTGQKSGTIAIAEKETGYA